MNYKDLLTFIKEKLANLSTVASLHKAPQPVKKAIDETIQSIYDFIIEKAMQKNKARSFVMNGFGDIVNIYDLKEKDFKPELFAQSLSREYRFWNQTLLSVAEHCTNMVEITKKLYPGRDDLAKWALIHEIYEAYTGDLATPFKRSLPSYIVAENKALANLAKSLNLPTTMPKEIHEIDKTMMISEAMQYMPLSDYWIELGKQMGMKEFGKELKPFSEEVLKLRETPLSPQQAAQEFARTWKQLGLPSNEILDNIANGIIEKKKPICFEDKVKEDGNFLQFVPAYLQTVKLCKTAIMQNPNAFKYIEDEVTKEILKNSIINKQNDIAVNFTKKMKL